MTGPALSDEIQLPGHRVHAGNLVGRVAIRTDRRQYVSRRRGDSVDALRVQGQDPGVTFTAGGRNIPPVNSRGGVGFGLGGMEAVTTRAVGCHQETALGEGAAVNRVHVQLVSIGYGDAMPSSQLWVAVTNATSPR